MQFVRLIIFWFIAMTVVYFCISLYSRSVRREKLEDAFDADHPDGGAPGMRDAFVAKGMEDYHKSIRPKLIALVYVIPFFVISTIVYIVNTN
ncbi:hypothetical protein [Yoonia sp. 2307UL14-13]|uniref:hypothetical protein n=1 Tax=Yoonia sp. 2307UL14-13 TaxID=3126506 RepID=UPI0030B4E886